MKRFSLIAATLVLALGASRANADLTSSLKKGTPELKSVGTLTFGPEGVLFIADPVAGSIVAVATGDTKADGKGAVKVEKLNEKIGATLGTSGDGVLINDLKVNPASGNVYISATRGKSAEGAPVLVRLDRAGKFTEVTLKDIPFASITLPNAKTTANARSKEIESITGIAFVDGKVIVAGLSTEQFASTLRVIPFPFKEADKGASIEIFHAAHNKLETASPVRTFLPFDIAGQTHIVASYTCTPLVKIPIADLKAGEKVKGSTVAELGNGNRPLDMIQYKKDGKEYILLSNSVRGVMKIDTTGIDKIEPITTGVKGTAGLKYDTIQELKNVVQLDKLDGERGLILVKNGNNFDLDTIPLP
jgi:hypothetical protein